MKIDFMLARYCRKIKTTVLLFLLRLTLLGISSSHKNVRLNQYSFGLDPSCYSNGGALVPCFSDISFPAPLTHSPKTAIGLEDGDKSSSSHRSSFANSIRNQFEMLNQKVNHHPLIYLDNSATSLKPRIVLEAINDFYSRSSANVHRSNHYFSTKATDAFESARDTVANFINASNREIIFTSGATASLNLIANSYGANTLESGDEIILSIAEHHSNIVPWQELALSKNLTIKYIKLNEHGDVDLEHFKSLLSPRTKLVSITHMSNVLGYYLPIAEIVKHAHEVGAKVVVDACQSIPNRKVDVKELDVDFLVASGHKMCGPNSIGFLYGKYNLLENMKPSTFGGEMIEEVDLYKSTFASPPTKFEAGTPPIAEAIGLAKAINFLDSLGLDNIEEYEKNIGKYLYNRLADFPDIETYGPKLRPEIQRGHIVSFNHQYLHPFDIATFIDQEGVALRAGHHCAQPLHKYGLKRTGSLRVSAYLYNTFEEIDLFIEKLRKVIGLLSSLHPNSNSGNSFIS